MSDLLFTLSALKIVPITANTSASITIHALAYPVMHKKIITAFIMNTNIAFSTAMLSTRLLVSSAVLMESIASFLIMQSALPISSSEPDLKIYTAFLLLNASQSVF